MHEVANAPQGWYRDELRHADGRVTPGEWRPNLILNGCRELLAAFVLGGGATGIQGLRVGRGSAAWDGAQAPRPLPDDTELVDPDAVDLPLAVGAIAFLDAAGDPTPVPTPRIEAVFTLPPGTPPVPPGEPAYPLREFGLLAALAGEPRLINSVRHPVVWKQAEDTLVRTIRLEF